MIYAISDPSTGGLDPQAARAALAPCRGAALLALAAYLGVLELVVGMESVSLLSAANAFLQIAERTLGAEEVGRSQSLEEEIDYALHGRPRRRMMRRNHSEHSYL